MNFCSGCGKPVTAGDKFCHGCGAPVVAVEKATSLVGASAAPVVYAGAPSEPAYIAPPPPPPVVPGGVPGMGLKAPSRKLLILAGSAVLLVVVVIVGGLVARNIIRGGAESPEQAASKMIESVSNKDLVGAFLMVTPRERDAVVRVQEAFLKKYADFKIADAVSAASGKANVASGKDAAGSELSFEGIDVSVTGVQPRVTPISDDLATVTLDSGEFRISVDPVKTKGIIRAGLDAASTTKKYEQTFFLADLGQNQSGLKMIAKKTDGRWYISPLLTGLEAAQGVARSSGEGFGEAGRGTVPAIAAKGSDSPIEAASAAVSALPRIPRDGVKALAPYLESAEADALYLYGTQWLNYYMSSEANQTDFTVGGATFTPGPQDGNRAVAFVDRVTFRAGSSGQTTITATCLSREGSSEKNCLNGSGYSGGQLVWGADRGKFAFTTVKEDGGWKVSLLDTAADHAVSWVNSLTREQALSSLGLERGDKATGTLTVGKQSTVAFNSAGYAVLKLQVPKTTQLELTEASEAAIFSPDGKPITYLYRSDGYGGGGDEVKAGNYTVVLHAGQKWFDAFAKKGNEVVYSAPVLIQRYVDQSTPTDSVPSSSDSAPSPTESAPSPAAGGATAVPVDQAKVAALMKKINANPKDIASLQAIGDLYFAAADYKTAATWEQKVLDVDPKNQIALVALGAAQFNQGNSAEAKKAWLIAAGLYPNSAEVHYDLGFLYMSQTPPDKANMIREWKIVVAIDPNSNYAKTVATYLKGATAAPSGTPSAK